MPATALTRPLRSMLYIPGDKARALEKARSLPADGILFDLEDAVAPDAKAQARATLADALNNASGYGQRLRLVRINGADTPWGAEDLAAACKMPCDGVLLPKVNSPEDLTAIAAQTTLPLWAMMETPEGILNAAAIAAHPRLEGMVMGTNDLAKDLTCATPPCRTPMRTALQTALLAAKAHGKVIVDGVFNAFRDEEGLEAECQQGRDFGFDGKSLIHPAQINTTNAVFSPNDAALAEASEMIAAFEQAQTEGKGIAVLNGRIVENLHVETARRLLAKADAIRILQEEASQS